VNLPYRRVNCGIRLDLNIFQINAYRLYTGNLFIPITNITLNSVIFTKFKNMYKYIFVCFYNLEYKKGTRLTFLRLMRRYLICDTLKRKKKNNWPYTNIFFWWISFDKCYGIHYKRRWFARKHAINRKGMSLSLTLIR